MTVWYRQSVNGAAGEPCPIEPHAPDQTDAELLDAKARGAVNMGWAVTWTGERSFSAVKDRWGGSLCVRDFWTD